MRSERFKRYQVNKKVSIQLNKKHPWVFSGNLSSAASGFQNGDPVKLVGPDNEIIGWGFYSENSRIAIRVFHFGETLRNRFFFKKLREIWNKKHKLKAETSGIRILNGEADQFPGVTADLYNDTVIIQYYDNSALKLARMASMLIPHVVEGVSNVHIRTATKSAKTATYNRTTRGTLPEELIIKESFYNFFLKPGAGQKSGFFLDLRGARRELQKHDFSGMRVLNLFSYSGAFSIVLAGLGASEIVSVDQSQEALSMLEKNIQLNNQDPKKHTLICADVFEWIQKLPAEEKFDFIILDPPCLASGMKHVNKALNLLNKLHANALSHLNDESMWLSCDCTARIGAEDLKIAIGTAAKPLFGKGQTQLYKELPTELDHTVLKTFPEGKYLKQLFYTNWK
jgi:23S rRNA (cytosine1962-C5)-methyltransferase